MPADRKRPRLTIACLALSVTLLAGCATGTNPEDPFESFNRGVYSFNEGIDKAIFKPAAEVYQAALPQFIRTSVSNFFGNINDMITVLNNVLQGKFTTAYADFGRVAINSTFGLLGLFDVATEAGIEKHREDFGQTLGWWGAGSGPFIMLPFFGPSSGRDSIGLVVDIFTDPTTYIDPTRTRNIMWGVRTVNRRAELLDASTVLQTAALDPYEFVRDAYLQRRRNLVSDGIASSGGELLDPPPKAQQGKPQATAPRYTPYPTAGETTGPGSILVSGESQTPVQWSHSYQTAPVPAGKSAAKAASRAIATTQHGVVATGEASAAQYDLLPPGQLTTVGATPPQQRALPNLAQFWRALALDK